MIRKGFIMLCLFIGAFYLTACSTEDVAKNTETGDSVLEFIESEENASEKKELEDNESEIKESENQEQQIKNEDVFEQQQDECVEPPRILRFKSYEEILALKELIDETDETVVLEYLSKKSYNVNGLNSREDIVHFFEKIETLEMPYFEVNDKWKLELVWYEVETDVLELVYSDGEEIIRFFGYWEEPENFSEEYSGENKVAINVGDKEVNLRFSSEEKPWVRGKIQTSNSYVTMRYQSKDKDKIVDKMASVNIKIAPMKQIIEKVWWEKDEVEYNNYNEVYVEGFTVAFEDCIANATNIVVAECIEIFTEGARIDLIFAPKDHLKGTIEEETIMVRKWSNFTYYMMDDGLSYTESVSGYEVGETYLLVLEKSGLANQERDRYSVLGDVFIREGTLEDASMYGRKRSLCAGEYALPVDTYADLRAYIETLVATES